MNDEWQPIDTAPKDGTTILTHSRRLGHVLVRYDAEHQAERDRFLDRTCWRVDWDGDYLASDPTHWMMLPEPPESSEEAR